MIDSGRHVYTNWQSVQAKRSYHPLFDPHGWANREVDYGPDACPATLEILSRTCSVELAPEVPTPAFRFLTRAMG